MLRSMKLTRSLSTAEKLEMPRLVLPAAVRTPVAGSKERR